MARRAIEKQLDALLLEPLLLLGFERHQEGVFWHELSTDSLGFLGLNTATARTGKGIELNILVGVRQLSIEQLWSQLNNEPFVRYGACSIIKHIGYLLPARKYSPIYIQDSSALTSGVVNSIRDTVQDYGLPFLRSHSSVASMADCLSRNACSSYFRRYVLAIALYLSGRRSQAMTFVEEECARIEGGDRLRFLQFAARFRRLPDLFH